MGHDHSSPGIESQGLAECKNVRATRVSTAASYEYRLTAVIMGFCCHVISCALARRGVRRGAAEASGRGGVQCAWTW